MKSVKPKVLAVDDSKVALMKLSGSLENFDCDFKTASSGEKALEVIEDWVPDLVLLDAILPGLQGLDVLREVRQNPDLKDVSVVMLTAKGDKQFVRDALLGGTDDILLKPYVEEDLNKKVRLQTFSPQVKVVRALLRNLNMPDEALHKLPGLDKLDKKKVMLFSMTASNLPLCIGVNRQTPISDLLIGEDDGIKRNVCIYGRGIGWKRLWPKASELKPKKKRYIPVNHDITDIIEQYGKDL